MTRTKLIHKINRKLTSIIHSLRKRIRNDKNIYIIYTMGKVGSSTVYQSLKSKKAYSYVFHTHFLSENYLDHILPELHHNFHKNISAGKAILSHIKKRPNSRIKIITLAREPISRSISDLFENWKHIYDNIEDVPKEELKAHIESLRHEYTLEWFDEEFKKYLDFDIYDQQFNQNKGYGIYQHKNFDILCIKLEKLNMVWESAFTEFLGYHIPKSMRNVSKNKKGAESYNFLTEGVSLDTDSLNKIYDSKYVKHFYSAEEINGFIKKWNGTT